MFLQIGESIGWIQSNNPKPPSFAFDFNRLPGLRRPIQNFEEVFSQLRGLHSYFPPL
jgi:hypothetical protein